MSKNLQYFLDHPDEMPTDTKEIEALAAEHMNESIAAGEQQLDMDKLAPKDEPKAETPEEKPEEKPVEKAASDEKPAETPKSEKPTLMAKDGKNVIPYAVLEGTRERAVRAEALAAEQAAEIERLKSIGSTEKPAETEVLTEDELTALAADSPTLAKVLRTQQDTIAKLTTSISELRNRAVGEDTARAAAVKSEVQSAIDSIPTMLEWQTAEDKTLWNEAARIDRILRESPKFAEASFEERFKVVGRMTCETLGLDVPKDFLDPEPPKEPEKPKLTDAEIRAAAEAKLKGRAVPKSLSDIPGGSPPPIDERDRVEQMSVGELGSKMMGMSKDQLEAYLATL